MKSYTGIKNLDNVMINSDIELENNKEYLLNLWKRKKPAQGYNRAYTAEFPDGTKVNIEYNFVREVVKIEFFPSDDTRHFYVMIQRGTILQEREFQSNRPVSLFSRLNKYKKYFGYMYDEQVLKTVGGCYEIPLESKHPYATRDFHHLQFKKIIKFKPKLFRERIAEYLKQKEQRQNQYRGIKKILYRLPSDIFDGLMILSLFYLFYLGKMSSINFSLTSIFYSVMSGFIDIYWRRRNPLITKALLFSLPGLVIFWFHYQLIEWGIDEPAYKYLNVLFSLLKEKIGLT